MFSSVLGTIESPVTCLRTLAAYSLFAAAAYVSSYVVYQRYFHPLASYPGPFLASLTDLWQVNQFLSLKQPYNLTDLHAEYGQFVRYGPDKLSTTAEEAISLLFQKGGRMFPKTAFYDAYGASHPNVFGMRDEAVCYLEADRHLVYVLTNDQATLCPTASYVAHFLHVLCEGNGASYRLQCSNFEG